jgi:hypothetical protein
MIQRPTEPRLLASVRKAVGEQVRERTGLAAAVSLKALVALCLAGIAFAASTSAVEAPRPLRTAFVDPYVFNSPDGARGLSRAAAAGATAIKVPLFWDTVAPASPPPGFEPANPSDPAYNWVQLDAQLRLVRAHNLEPIVYIAGPPSWAKRTNQGFARPDPARYRAFALAAVRRYSGQAGRPRVRYWQAWNEPNKVPNPAYKPGAAAWYRALVNAFAASVHSRPGNLVIAGGLAPFGIRTAVAPLEFMRSVLCLSSGRRPQATCSARVRFDIWSTHPYTAGGPTRSAYRANDVSLGDLPEMKAVLDAGVAGRRIVSSQRVQFWVTEFSWDTKPPDPAGVPAALEGRWVAEALYRMWSAGVSLVVWFTLRDHPVRATPYQSGLYFNGKTVASDRPKPALTAFRFPFVALRRGKNIFVWGRTPTSKAATVIVEQHGSSGWRRVASPAANRVGIFSSELRTSGGGRLRARLPGVGTSLPFSLVAPPDRVYQPFGS